MLYKYLYQNNKSNKYNYSSIINIINYLHPKKTIISYSSTSSNQSNNIINEEINENKNHINYLFDNNSFLSSYWKYYCENITRPSSLNVLKQLIPYNTLGYNYNNKLTLNNNNNKNIKKNENLNLNFSRKNKNSIKNSIKYLQQKPTNLIQFILKEKDLYPNNILLVRIGEFYETFGIDSLMLIEYAGLNPMANKPRAGCPNKNIQSVLDSLIHYGFNVCIYEEMNDNDSNLYKKRGMKHRILSQIITPASPIYLYTNYFNLNMNDIIFQDSKPYVGIYKGTQGYDLIKIYIDQKCIEINTRLTEEGIRILYDTYTYTTPIFLSNNLTLYELNQLYLSSMNTNTYYSNDEIEKYKLNSLNLDDFIQQMKLNIEKLLNINMKNYYIRKQSNEYRPRPLYSITASQIGIIKNEHIPDLIQSLLPKQFPYYSSKFLRRWLLNPPPYIIADSMHQLLNQLNQFIYPLPSSRPLHIGKMVSLLSTGQCNVPLFRDIYENVKTMLMILDDNDNIYRSLIDPLLNILEYESGFNANKKLLISKSKKILIEIEKKIISINDEDNISYDPKNRIPETFIEKNEDLFRNNIKSNSSNEMKRLYNEIDEKWNQLLNIIDQELDDNIIFTFDIHNNIITLKTKPKINNNNIEFIKPFDRNGKIISNRYLTENIYNAMKEYKKICQDTLLYVSNELKLLSKLLEKQLSTIIQAAHFSVILQTASLHTSSSRIKGWTLPILENLENNNNNNNNNNLKLNKLIPYWMNYDTGISNNIDFSNMILLTAPNMSGKSTLMRSIMVASLLGNCGLFIPAKENSFIPRYDNFFLRTTSFDIPSEGKSAFALEIDDVRIMLCDSTNKSLIMMDELGKGTSARDGSAIAGSLLEYLDHKNITGIFSTHLHEIFQLPLKLNNTIEKKMGFIIDNNNNIKWTYKIEDGKCFDSLALETAKKYLLKDEIITRAKDLTLYFDQYIKLNNQNNNIYNNNNNKEEDINNNKEEDNNNNNNNNNNSKEENKEEIYPFDNENKYNLNNIKIILNEYIEENPIIIVNKGFDTPPYFESKACLYILEIKQDNKILYYVGETESIRQRMKQHRSYYGLNNIQSFLIVNMNNKSNARRMETLLINKLKLNGYPLISDHDSQHIHFST